MIIQIDLESEVPIYLQLMHSIKEGIATRELSPGDTLPSVRALASDLGVNMHTVNKTYQYLKQEDLILIHRQKGVVVNPHLPAADQAFLSQLDEDLYRLAVDAICRGMKEEQFMERCRAMFQKVQTKRKGDGQ